MKALVDPMLYRNLELSENDGKLKPTAHTFKRLLDTTDDLSLHVRDLVVSGTRRGSTNVGNLKETSDHFLGDLERVIGKLHRLQSFSWNVRRPIPEAIIVMLEQDWPNITLSAGSHDLPITDTRLLYSPLLRSLSFCILNHTATVTATRQPEQYSKLPELREVLLRNPNLRKLSIEFEYNWIDRRVKWTGITANPRVLNLPLRRSDRLPPLQELTFSGPPETYEFDQKHCKMLRKCMDWSQLRRLDLGISCPQHFFEVIGNSLSSLESLTMGIRTGNRRFTHWQHGPLTCDDLSPTKAFLVSVCGLHELNITDLDHAVGSISPVILREYRVIRKLYYHASIDRNNAHQHRSPPYKYEWTPQALGMLRTQCRDLKDLTIDFPLVEGHWPVEHARTLAQFSHLDKLKVFVELGSDASDFSAAYHQDAMGTIPMPELNFAASKKVTEDLFTAVFVNNPYSSLTSLEVCFLRHLHEDRGQQYANQNSFRIQRLERDDSPSPLDGGYTMDAPGLWVDCNARTGRVV
ncbi:MAG: hypothetical protein Q9209_006644 [Squamulea sp. 1 TL-2023]